MKFSLLVLLWLFFYTTPVAAQLGKRLKERVIQKGKDEGRQQVGNARARAWQEYKELSSEFDSTDYEYALLLSDNAGLFAARHKGESRAKFMKMGQIIHSAIDNANLSPEENANLNLEIGQTSYAMGRFVFAEKRLNRAKFYFEQAGLENDLGYLRTLSSYGLLYTSMGRFKLADEYIGKSLQLRKVLFGEDDPGLTALTNNQAVLCFNTGQYNESEKAIAEAIQKMGPNGAATMPMAIALNNQAILYQSLGRYEEAVENLRKAITIASGLESSRAKHHLKFYSNLALLYQQMGKFDDAENTYRILENKYERGKTEFANLLNNLAILLFVKGKHDRVEEMLRNAAAIFKSNLGENSPAYAKVMSDLGNFLRFKERYGEAQPILQRTLEIRESTLGPNHPLYVQSQEDLAILYWKTRERSKAEALYNDVMGKTIDFINKYFPPMSEAEKTKYWDLLAPRFQRYYNFVLETSPQNKQMLIDLFEYRLATKGLLLNSSRKLTESILASGNEQIITDFISWIDRKEELTRLYAYSKEELAEQQVNLDSLETVANQMEKNLSEQSTEFSQLFFAKRVRFEEIRGKLKQGEALLEFIRLRNFNQTLTEESKYLVLIARSTDQAPAIIILDKGKELETSFFKSYRAGIKNRLNDEQSFKNYWEPIEKNLEGIKKIFVSVDGVYNQVNLNTLKRPGGNFLIDQYDITFLGNLRDIANQKKKAFGNVLDATLIGHPVYASEKIPDLPGTRVEVDSINTVLSGSGYSVKEFVQQDATENNLKAARRVNILHIATHGYFYKDVDKLIWPIGVHADYAKENVLLRSGLILTEGADPEKLNMGFDNTSNGIISSYEAMNLDLNGTELVVLSACETGLGEVKAGEGVYGLQRAFLAAGARTLIMSLWKVDDAATQQLMTYFYKNLAKSKDKQSAFKKAQLALMKKYPAPYYWGGFIMIGE